MSSQTPLLPAITFANVSSEGDETAVTEVASKSTSGGGDTLSPRATTNGKYSIVQPGVLLTEIQSELEGPLSKPTMAEVRGGHADVYKGLWIRPGGKEIDVAIKVLRVGIPSSMTTDKTLLRDKIDIRMKRETLIWTRATHPNIHTFLGFRLGDEPQLISPWCAQGNLADYLKSNKGLCRIRKLRLINQAALGLAFLHGQTPPICHADIKPENILINDSDEAALSDFGVSRVLESLAEHTGLTTSGGGANGTYPYSAPEVFNPALSGNNVKSSCESDVYAFGGLILAVMSEKPPFHRITPKVLITVEVLGGKTPEPKDHDLLTGNDDLWSVMNECWKFHQSARLSMNDVLKKIEEIALSSCYKSLYVRSMYSVGCRFRLM